MINLNVFERGVGHVLTVPTGISCSLPVLGDIESYGQRKRKEGSKNSQDFIGRSRVWGFTPHQKLPPRFAPEQCLILNI
jgi:hypothetical protein